MSDTIEHSVRAGRTEWIGLAVLALPSMLITMDLTVLHLAVPHLTEDLSPSSSQLLWITDIYGFLIAGFLITMGTLGDRIGRRRVLLFGAAGFGATSVLAAYSQSAEMLIVARGLMGLAGATLMPSTLSLIRNMFHDPQERTKAIAVWMMSFMVGGSIGPLVGGALLESFWWGSVFLVGVPAMLLLVATGPFVLPEYRDPSAGRLDLLSSVLLVASILPVVYAIKHWAEHGFTWSYVALFGAGAVVGVIFVGRQRTLRSPLLDVALFRIPAFGGSIAVMTASTFAMMGLNLFFMQYLQLVRGYSPFEAGLWVLPMTGAMMLAMTITPALAARIRPGLVIAGGLAVSAVGIALMTRVSGDSTDFALAVTGSALMGAGLAPGAALSTDLVVGAAPAESAGSASAMSETSNELGGAMGLAFLGSIGTAVFRSSFDPEAVDGLTPADAAAARETLGGAIEVARGAPPDAAASLVAGAQDAFTDAFRMAALAAAVIVAVAVGLALTVLRSAGVSESHDARDEDTDAAATEDRGDCDPVGSCA